MRQGNLTNRALAQLLTFYGALDAPPVAAPAATGEAIDAALATPPEPVAAPEGLDAAMILKGLRLPPP